MNPTATESVRAGFVDGHRTDLAARVCHQVIGRGDLAACSSGTATDALTPPKVGLGARPVHW